MPGFRPARVRAILQLPSHLRHYFPCTLVYLELFTRFKHDPASGFYRTSPAFQDGHREVVVIPLSAVRMSCQLVPNFRAVPRGVVLNSSIDILDVCQEFSFNPYADHFLFAVMHHWESCARAAHAARK